jgi:predicted MFS family arabinose efflux permease
MVHAARSSGSEERAMTSATAPGCALGELCGRICGWGMVIVAITGNKGELIPAS